MNIRKERGQYIAEHGKIAQRDGYYLVPSQNEVNKSYRVRLGDKPSCSCPDFQKRGEEIGSCKHIFAVEFKFTSYTDHKGNTVTERTTRITYGQEWSAYDRAQTTEKEEFLKLLNDLCESVEQPTYSFGRPSLPMRDMVFASVLKVYTTFSLRRFSSDMRFAQEKGYMVKTPCYASVGHFFQKKELTPILLSLIQKTSLPLRTVESDFAVDSSGFSTGMFSRWFDYRYGKTKEARTWLKAHIMVGTKTNVVTAVKITEGSSSDSKEFSGLVKETADNFMVKEVSADKAYLSKENFRTVNDIGGTAFIPFKKDSVGKARGSMLWSKMYHYFAYNQEEFMAHYHKRSNVETTFSMIKRKFGSALKSKTETAQVNEVLLKILAHNICVVIQERNELEIEF